MRGRGDERDRGERDRPPSQRAAAGRGREPVASGGRLDRERDQARIRQLTAKWRAMEQAHPCWGHSFREHVDATDQQLARRAAKGVNARGHQAVVPEHATRWQSSDAMTLAAHGLWYSDERRRVQGQALADRDTQFAVRRPLSELLGAQWRADVYGRSARSDGARLSQWRDSSCAVAIWRLQSDGRWHLLSCYPEATPRPAI